MMAEMILFMVVALSCLGFGTFVFLRPLRMIELQKKFYEKINWRIEPISLPKEIRNTKIMGCFLIIFVVLAVLITVVQPDLFVPVFNLFFPGRY